MLMICEDDPDFNDGGVWEKPIRSVHVPEGLAV
jgi:hypothetical protein